MDKFLELLKEAGVEITDDLKKKVKTIWDEGTNIDTDDLFTQEDVNEIVKNRLGREQKLHKQEIDELKEQMKGMVDPDKVQEYETKIKELETQSAENKSNLKKEYELKIAAVNSGMRKEAIDDFVELTDLSVLEVDEDGNVTGTDKLIETTKEKKAYLFSDEGSGSAGGDDFKGGGGRPVDEDKLSDKEYFAYQREKQKE